MNNPRGFTLIELMIVISIIGILAAIAIPAFNEYQTKAKEAEALLASTTSRKAVEDYYAFHGSLPVDNQASGLTAADNIRGNFFSSITVVNGAVIIRFDERGGTQLAGKTLSMFPIINPNYPLRISLWCRDSDWSYRDDNDCSEKSYVQAGEHESLSDERKKKHKPRIRRSGKDD